MAQIIVPQQRQKRDAIDVLLAGLQAAQTVYGIKTDMAKLDDYKQNQELARTKVGLEQSKLDNETNLTSAQVDKLHAEAANVGREKGNLREVKYSLDGKNYITSLGPSERLPDGAIPYEEPKKLTPEQELALQERHDRIQAEKRSKFIPGLGAADTTDDAKQIRTALDSYNQLKYNISRIRDLRTKFGSEVLDREAIAEGRNLATDAQLNLKGTYGLGQISAGDQKFLNDLMPSDPLTVEWTGSTFSKLNTLEKSLDNRIANQLKLRGFNKETVDSYVSAMSAPHAGEEVLSPIGFGNDTAFAGKNDKIKPVDQMNETELDAELERLKNGRRPKK